MRRRIIALTTGLVFFLGCTIILIHFYLTIDRVTRSSGARLQGIVTTAALAVDGDLHTALNECLSRSCPGYKKLSSYLRKVQQSVGLDTEIYTLARSGEGTRFVVRTHTAYPVGSPYDLRDEMRPVFDHGESVITGIYEDSYGEWISAYAPILDSRGKVVALLEADFRVQRLMDELRTEINEFARLLLLFMLLAIGLAWREAHKLTEPLNQLTAAVDAIAQGDDTAPIPDSAPSQIGHLARRFGSMRRTIIASRKSDQLATVGRMAASLVHDLRGPLQVISGMSELVQGEDDEQERVAVAGTIYEQSRRMEAMCRDLLDFSRGEYELRPSSFRSSTLLEEVTKDLAAIALARRGRLAVSISSNAVVCADMDKMRRLLYNLGKNALEVTPPDGVVEFGCDGNLSSWSLYVKDEGPGIAPEMAAGLFKPFATHGKANGTGLGLAIVKRITEAHGGAIRVESAPGEGATFIVDLPHQSPKELLSPIGLESGSRSSSS